VQLKPVVQRPDGTIYDVLPKDSANNC
jgi:hypothetical protein